VIPFDLGNMLMLTPQVEEPKLREFCGYATAVLEGHPIVRVVYSDESGVGSKNEGPIALVTAIVVNIDKCWPGIESEMADILKQTPKTLLERQRELKGARLYSALRKDIPEREAARRTLGRTLAITANESIPMFYGAVDREGYDRYAASVKRSGTELYRGREKDRAESKIATCADV
jgi:hypothetical protein